MPGHESVPLLAYLKSLNADQLATVLRRRPDAVALPWPAHIANLADRLQSHDSISEAFYRLSQPQVEVLGALTLVSLLEQPLNAANAAQWLGGDVDAVQEVLDDLEESALVWPIGGGELETLHRFPVSGTALGRPIRTLLNQATLAKMRTIAAKLKIRGDGTKYEVVNRLAAYLCDAEVVSVLVESAPPDERDILLECATQGAALEYYEAHYGSYNGTRVGDWSVARGLLWPDADGYAAMPLEVALGLRGDGWRLPFHPKPPVVELHPVSAEHVDAEAATHLMRQIELISRLLDSAAAEMIPLVKTGSVAVRALRTFAKEADADIDQISLAVTLALTIGVLVPADPPAPKGRRKQPPPTSPGLIPGDAAPAWLDSDARLRGTQILRTWWVSELDDLPGTSVDEHLRKNLIAAYAEFPQGQGVSAVSDINELMQWRVPFAADDVLETVLGSIEREAELLGVLALGAATSLGRALITGGLETATASLVSGAHTSAVIGADLTAVVFGPPTTQLSRFLDSVATRESRGQATMWRFTADSVRAGFDNGMTRDELLDGLTAIAQSGVPQPLEYLVNDVARTHGHMGVIGLGSVVVGEDPALLRELVGHRKLTKLGLWTLAPTVIGSRADATTTLAALRGAGYAPVPRDTDGAVVVSATTSSAVEPAVEVAAIEVSEFDPERHARHLIATAHQPAPTRKRGFEFFTALRSQGDHTAIWMLAAGRPVLLTQGERTDLVHSAILHERTLTAWNTATEQYEDVPIGGIDVVEVP